MRTAVETTVQPQDLTRTIQMVSETAIEYGLSCKKSEFPRVKITSSEEASKFIRGFYGEDINIFESVYILLMNISGITVGYAKISQGGIVGTVVDVKIVLKYAIDSFAASVILAHNHPSGSARPSSPDIELTQKIKKALKIVDSKLLDHIILTDDSYYSFGDNDML